MAERLRAMGQPNYVNGFHLTVQPPMLELPLKWKKPQTIFVNSMSDLFHEDVPLAYIHEVFDVMARAHWHRFQVLTKRAERLKEVSPELPWAPQIWMGVSVESAPYLHRIEALRQTGAYRRFVSLEPLLGPMPHLDLKGIDWVITGGESGPQARPIDPAWVRQIRDHCREQGIPLFFKQWGRVKHNPDPADPTIAKGHPFHAKGGCQLDGAVIWEKPIVLEDGHPANGHHQLEGREGAGSHASPETGRNPEAPRTRQRGRR
jgi:protein gp37